MLLVLDARFFCGGGLRGAAQAEPRRIAKFFGCAGLRHKKDQPNGLALCACVLVMGSDQHQTDHADYAKQYGCNGS